MRIETIEKLACEIRNSKYIFGCQDILEIRQTSKFECLLSCLLRARGLAKTFWM